MTRNISLGIDLLEIVPRLRHLALFSALDTYKVGYQLPQLTECTLGDCGMCRNSTAVTQIYTSCA